MPPSFALQKSNFKEAAGYNKLASTPLDIYAQGREHEVFSNGTHQLRWQTGQIRVLQADQIRP